MRKSINSKLATSILIGAIICLPTNYVYAAENSLKEIGNNNNLVVTKEFVPSITQQEVNNGFLDNGNDLPDEFIVKSEEVSNTTNGRMLLKSATTGTEKWSKVSTSRKLTNGKIGWHPAWSNYQYNISAYYFSSSKYSVSFNLGYGAISTSVSKAGGGQIIKSDPKKWTRPGVYGNVDRIKWNVKKYNGAGIYTSSTTKYTNNSSGVYVKSVNK